MRDITLTITLCLLIIASYTDLLTQKVPNKITFPSIAIGLILSIYPTPFTLLIKLGWIIIYLVIGSLRIMGMGDLKLCIAVLSLRGPEEAAVMLFAGSIILLFYCLITEHNNMVESLKDLFRMLFYSTGFVKRSNKVYPFALFLALGYSFNFIF